MNKHFPRALVASSVAVAALWSTQSNAAAEPVDTCGTHLISTATSYPDDSARARRGGKVLLALTIAPSGMVTGATVQTSSGSRLLDNAALDGAMTRWRFEPSNCGEPIEKYVAVEFEPRIFTTFTAMKVPAYRNKLLAAVERGCEVTEDDANESVITCVEGGSSRTRLAER